MQKDSPIYPKAYLLLHNVSNIIRSACAFGFEGVHYVSSRPQARKQKILKEFSMFGNQGTYKQLTYHPHPSLSECVHALHQQGVRICGVEIGEQSRPIHQHPFTGSTAFFLGNEGDGIIEAHKQYCDFFVYIPQYTHKTASLNVSVAAGIVFHHFALWAQYPQATFQGEKYQAAVQAGEEKEKEKKEEGEGEKRTGQEQNVEWEQLGGEGCFD